MAAQRRIDLVLDSVKRLLRIGATATLEELAENGAVRSEYPSLVQAALGVTSPQIRNMGTVGGDLCQRPRCWYFRQGFGLLGKDKDGTSLAPIVEVASLCPVRSVRRKAERRARIRRRDRR